MARFLRFFRPNARNYSLEIKVDGGGHSEPTRSIEIAARMHDPEQSLELTARLEIDGEANRLNLSVEGSRVAELPLYETAIAQADLDASDEPGSALADIGNVVGIDLARSVEEAISWVPVPDPVLGCLLKGAIAATAGQIVRCYGQTEEVEGVGNRVRAIAWCVGGSAWELLGRAGHRAVLCFVRLGVGG